jgi:hypothetical protein
MNAKLYLKLMFSAMLVIFASNASADVTGTIAGLVKDASGASVQDVAVTVTNVGTRAKFTTKSDPTGSYSLRDLPVGVYDLAAEVTGFKEFVSDGIRVQVNETVRLDVTLVVGAVTQAVEVSGQVSTVDTEGATLKEVVDQQRIEDLPLNGRDAVQLMQLVAGVQPDDINGNVTSGATYPGVTPVSVDGGRDNTANYILDGAQNNDHYSNAPNPMPNPDALQEFSVQTNNFSAEYGRNVGGIVNAVTKSGTNALHGTAFEYLRNYAVNAYNYFAPINSNGGKQSDGLKRNQFGATLGGPVLLPHLYNGKDRTFFFFSYQGTRSDQVPTTVNQVVPTAAEKAGNFSTLSTQLKDPFTGGVYANNQIPSSDFAPASVFILNNWIPNPALGTNTIYYGLPTNVNDDQTLVRIDHKLSSNNSLMGRFWISSANQPGYLDPTNYIADFYGESWRNTSVAVSDTTTFSPNVLNTGLFSYNRTNYTAIPIYPSKSFQQLGINMYSDNQQPEDYVDVTGYFGIMDQGNSDTNTFLREEYQGSDTLRWATGKHQLSMGGEYGHGYGGIVNTYENGGYFTFSGAAPFTGNSLADFLVGKFSNLTQGAGQYKNTEFNYMALFIQDVYRIKNRVTLNLGMRWEPFFPYMDQNGKLAAWRPGQQSTRYPNAPKGLLFAGDPGIPAGGYNTAWKNFGPRVGVAWDVFGDGSTSLRAGYGIFYDRPNTISTNSQADQAPFGPVVSISGNATNSFMNPYAGATNPFPATTTPPSNVAWGPFLPDVAFVYAAGMRNAYMQAWTLSLERRLAPDLVFRAAYAGSEGTHLASLEEGNPAIYAPGATTATTNQRRAFYPNFASVTLVEPSDTSSYNSLQLSVERRFRNGFSVLGNYTYSRSIDESSASKQTGQTVTDPFIGPSFDRGLSDFDHTHVASISGLWEIPGKVSNPFAEALLGGWKLTGIVALRSGFVFTVYSDVDNSLSGVGKDRPNLVGNPHLAGGRNLSQRANEWLNTAAFAPNALGTFGNVGRNSFFGPGYADTDLAIHKDFHLMEKLTAQFRFEAFNAFNRVNLQAPNLYIDSSTFMQISSAYDPRILQGALRLMW